MLIKYVQGKPYFTNAFCVKALLHVCKFSCDLIVSKIVSREMFRKINDGVSFYFLRSSENSPSITFDQISVAAR